MAEVFGTNEILSLVEKYDMPTLDKFEVESLEELELGEMPKLEWSSFINLTNIVFIS